MIESEMRCILQPCKMGTYQEQQKDTRIPSTWKAYMIQKWKIYIVTATIHFVLEVKLKLVNQVWCLLLWDCRYVFTIRCTSLLLLLLLHQWLKIAARARNAHKFKLWLSLSLSPFFFVCFCSCSCCFILFSRSQFLFLVT